MRVEAQFSFFKRSLNNLGAAELYYTFQPLSKMRIFMKH